VRDEAFNDGIQVGSSETGNYMALTLMIVNQASFERILWATLFFSIYADYN
jgi:hypothetical protein